MVGDDLLNAYLRILVLMYADDTVLQCDNELSVMQILTSFHKYCSEWKLNFKIGKTKILKFSRGQVQTSNFDFSLGGEKVEVVNGYEYLGILFNYNGRFREGELELHSEKSNPDSKFLSGRRWRSG